jgi:hypothetical protein
VKLAALIAASCETDEPSGGLRATLPVAGRTLLERQVRLAASAGADPIIILAEHFTSELSLALNRLRHDGMPITLVRGARDAANAVEENARLLLIADGLLVPSEHLDRLLGCEGSALTTIPDDTADERFERIDAHSRSGGTAIVEARLLHETAPEIQDWDLHSTLLRRAVQSGARQFAFPSAMEEGELVIAERASDLSPIERRIMEGVVTPGDGWASRYLLAPLEQAATRLLMAGKFTPEWLWLAANFLTAAGAFLFARDVLWAGAMLLLLSTPLDGIAERLSKLRMQRSAIRSWWCYLLPAGAAAALLALGYAVSERQGWGCLVLAVSAIAFLLALRGETSGRQVTGRAWLAERKGMIWLMLPFAATGLWTAGLGLLAVYAAASFFWAQRQVHRLS